MIPASAKPIEIEPLAGLFDHRSPADAVPQGVWRYLQNVEMIARRQLRRSRGWEKLLTEVGYNNQDFHDHLLSQSTGSMRQPITLIHQLTSPAGFSKLLIGTSKRLAVLNNSVGNWRIISDQLGTGLGVMCEDQGWRVAQVDYTVVMTNGLDKPVYYVLDQPPIETGDQSVTTIADLDKIGLTMAKTVISFKGIVIFGNVLMDGERIAHRLVWSDASRPLSWVPRAGESAAGFQDLGYGDDILEMKQLGDSLLVYTTGGIWEGLLVGGDTPLFFRRRYSDNEAGNRCLAYRRTLVSTGSDHYYLGRDGIYRYNYYTDRPLREEWMHLASSVIFDDISTSCHIHVAGYNATEKSLYISWGRQGEQCASQTLVLNTEYESDYVLDHGFSAFTNYNPDEVTTWRDWIISNCICAPGQVSVTEGDPVDVTWNNVVGATNTGNSLTKTAADGWGNSGAISNESIPAGDGYLEVSPAQTNLTTMIGFGDATDSGQETIELIYGMHFNGLGVMEIYESNVLQLDAGAYTTSDVFRIEIIAGVVYYKKNGVVIFTSTLPPVYPLHVEGIMHHTGASIHGVTIQDESMDVTEVVGELETIKEGGFCVAPVVAVDCEPMQYFYTNVLRTVDDITVEDWEQPTAHPDSLCARLGDLTMNRLCASELEADECNAEQLFVAASTQDYALKQLGTAYSRERNIDTSPCGAYVYDGYTSILRSGPMDFKSPSRDKLIRHMLADLDAEEAAVPSDLKLRVAGAYQPADPNSGRCSLRWFQQSTRKLKCTSVTGETHIARNTRQNPAIEWPLYLQDRYIVYELSIEGTGGATTFTKVVFWVEEKKL